MGPIEPAAGVTAANPAGTNGEVGGRVPHRQAWMVTSWKARCVTAC
jgi:hypothetical protein